VNLAPFESLLKAAIGLDAASIGTSAVERAVKMRAHASDAGDAKAYLDRLRSSPAELAELVDAVVVPETWFFRDRGAFSVLERFVREEASDKHPLRLLSFPCATGEEPYSIAMTLIEAGLPGDRFRIDACDVNPRLIARAAAGVYGKNSFRGADLAFRGRHFTREMEGYRLAETVRRAVHFREGNLLHPGSIGRGMPYDAVFCRNLLIYFDAATQERAFEVLTGLVRAGGLLFVGPSEANLVRSHGFEPVKAQLAFAFRKRSSAAPATARDALRSRPQRTAAAATPAPRGAVGSPKGSARRPFSSPLSSPPASRPAAKNDAGLGEIQSLADAGHLAEAARLCEAHLAEAGGASADAIVLLALIRDAAGNAGEAIELYRKALYLDPGHESALVHLRLRLEEQGDAAGAKRLDDRIRRIAARRAT
jgi:chemotaxis protein methyltransferase WspC